MPGFHRLLELDPHASVNVMQSALPRPLVLVEQAGHGAALDRHVNAWRAKVASGQASNGTAVALRSFQRLASGVLQVSFTPHPYVEHRAIRDLCQEVRPLVQPSQVDPAWNTGFPLFMAVVDEHEHLIVVHRSAHVAVAPNRIGLAFTEGSALGDWLPRLPVAMVQRCLAEELGIVQDVETVARAMHHTHLVLDAAQTQWGLFSLVRLSAFGPNPLAHRQVAPDAWEASAWLRVPFTGQALSAFEAEQGKHFAKDGPGLVALLKRWAA